MVLNSSRGGLNQKEFNSKSQKELRKKVDIANGRRELLSRIRLDDNEVRRGEEAKKKHYDNFGDKYCKQANQAEKRRVEIENRQFDILSDSKKDHIKRQNMVDNLEKGYNKALFAREDAKDGLYTLEAQSKEAKLKALGRQASQQESKRQAINESIKRADRLKKINKNQPLLKKVKRSLKKLIK